MTPEQKKQLYLFLALTGGLALFFHMVPGVLADPVVTLPNVPGLPAVSNNGNSTFLTFLRTSLLPIAKTVLQGVAIFYITYYGSRVVLASGNEDSIKKGRLGIIYSIFGFIIISVGDLFNKVFNPLDNAGEPDLFTWQFIINLLISGLRYSAGIVAVAWIILSGYRIVTSNGKEDIITKNRTQLLYSVMGLIFVAMAGTFQEIAFNAKTTEGISVIASLINLMLLFTVPIGFFMLVLGGFYMVSAAGNDTRVNKGRKIVTATLLAMVIIYSSYTVLTEVLKFANW